jgi:hypothetical protein
MEKRKHKKTILRIFVAHRWGLFWYLYGGLYDGWGIIYLWMGHNKDYRYDLNEREKYQKTKNTAQTQVHKCIKKSGDMNGWCMHDGMK